MVTNQTTKRSCLSIYSKTKQDLDSIKHTGQSYDGVIQELIDLWKKVKEEAARLEQRS